MKNFENYLIEKKLSIRTVEIYTQLYSVFSRWSETQEILVTEASYNDIMDFIADCRKKEYSSQHINNIISVIRHYYYYLVESGQVTNNIASNIYLKSDRSKKVLGEVLAYDKLEEISSTYVANDDAELIEKIVLGLLFFQAMRMFELDKLLTEDIDFDKGVIVIRGVKRTNERKLILSSQQILPMYRYLDSKTKRFLGDEKARNVIERLFRRLSKAYGITGIHQIRTATIVHWLKSGNLREVQYMCGHKYVSSTEKYKLDSLEELKDEIETLHPLN